MDDVGLGMDDAEYEDDYEFSSVSSLSDASQMELEDMAELVILTCVAGDARLLAKVLVTEKGGQLDLDGVTSADGDTPMVLACHGGHVDVVAVLLAAGASPDAEAPSEEIPILVAIEESHLDVVELLLDSGALHVNTGGAYDALDCVITALDAGDPTVVGALAEAGAQLGGHFLAAIEMGDDEVVELLLAVDQFAPARIEDPQGRGPIELAVAAGNASTLLLLANSQLFPSCIISLDTSGLINPQRIISAIEHPELASLFEHQYSEAEQTLDIAYHNPAIPFPLPLSSSHSSMLSQPSSPRGRKVQFADGHSIMNDVLDAESSDMLSDDDNQKIFTSLPEIASDAFGLPPPMPDTVAKAEELAATSAKAEADAPAEARAAAEAHAREAAEARAMALMERHDHELAQLHARALAEAQARAGIEAKLERLASQQHASLVAAEQRATAEAEARRNAEERARAAAEEKIRAIAMAQARGRAEGRMSALAEAAEEEERRKAAVAEAALKKAAHDRVMAAKAAREQRLAAADAAAAAQVLPPTTDTADAASVASSSLSQTSQGSKRLEARKRAAEAKQTALASDRDARHDELVVKQSARAAEVRRRNERAARVARAAEAKTVAWADGGDESPSQRKPRPKPSRTERTRPRQPVRHDSSESESDDGGEDVHELTAYLTGQLNARQEMVDELQNKLDRAQEMAMLAARRNEMLRRKLARLRLGAPMGSAFGMTAMLGSTLGNTMLQSAAKQSTGLPPSASRIEADLSKLREENRLLVASINKLRGEPDDASISDVASVVSALAPDWNEPQRVDLALPGSDSGADDGADDAYSYYDEDDEHFEGEPPTPSTRAPPRGERRKLVNPRLEKQLAAAKAASPQAIAAAQAKEHQAAMAARDAADAAEAAAAQQAAAQHQLAAQQQLLREQQAQIEAHRAHMHHMHQMHQHQLHAMWGQLQARPHPQALHPGYVPPGHAHPPPGYVAAPAPSSAPPPTDPMGRIGGPVQRVEVVRGSRTSRREKRAAKAVAQKQQPASAAPPAAPAPAAAALPEREALKQAALAAVVAERPELKGLTLHELELFLASQLRDPWEDDFEAEMLASSRRPRKGAAPTRPPRKSSSALAGMAATRGESNPFDAASPAVPSRRTDTAAASVSTRRHARRMDALSKRPPPSPVMTRRELMDHNKRERQVRKARVLASVNTTPGQRGRGRGNRATNRSRGRQPRRRGRVRVQP
ncbi:uncharacterized protein AMSG_10953 [Thecamonas trahens ATCC 50062]|uniref:Uncharacterized protein n=1 Tax=Thecamonas trahens ATCC 50062 TaxID=461836 RepID=A0A0L0DSR2_THETB|nr:hypothetical protein AMSG_10953 [Thecamonas trahens ATCC 50062]KNC55310.1 hypothetical protein AMSG_10953 [Thecamonas trahens ATCC 50062]|eukprot:XP_013753130.1 hypothetical protein AMSG_10953 [Thecamonas trahens ATCC 50062]